VIHTFLNSYWLLSKWHHTIEVWLAENKKSPFRRVRQRLIDIGGCPDSTFYVSFLLYGVYGLRPKERSAHRQQFTHSAASKILNQSSFFVVPFHHKIVTKKNTFQVLQFDLSIIIFDGFESLSPTSGCLPFSQHSW
jgi:hypothetical protein